MSLRARLLVVLLFVAAAVAITVDGVTYLSLRSFLLQRVDAQIDAAHRPIIRSVGSSVRIDDLETLAPGLYVEVRDPRGRVVQQVALRRAGEEAMSPPLPASLVVPEELAAGRSHDDVARRTISTNGDRFRVATWRLTSSGASLVLALPLDDLDSTMRRLLLVELVVTGAALAGGVVLARWLVTVGLRPLDDIATTAGAIAGGDLSRRVEREERSTEVGRLGGALNAMLGQIERAFAERRASEDRLRRFVADASHELRTPLTSIRAYAELFDRGADQRPDDLARLLKGIEAEAERMGVLVDDLLLLARLDQGRVLEGAPVDLGALAAESVDAARAIDPDRPVTLTVDGSVEVLGDRVRLRQVVDNLLANVRAHTPAGAPAAVSVGVAAERTVAMLEVTDRGPGIPEDDRPRVFERFYRADPSRSRDAGGAGLGLAIVAAIAAAHGGRAGVLAGPGGVGSSFCIELPLLDAPGTDTDS
jgi:two-component system OmpR family sensor kinase